MCLVVHGSGNSNHEIHETHEKGCREYESGLRCAIKDFSVFSVFRGLESSFFTWPCFISYLQSVNRKVKIFGGSSSNGLVK